MKKVLILASAALMLNACSSLQYAGNASYSVKPFTNEKGVVICCAVDVHNGKEIANLEAHVTKRGEDFTVDLKEQGVEAFKGQQISATALAATVDAAAKAAVAAALAPVLPTLATGAGGILSNGGLGAAALGGAAVIGGQKSGVLK